MMLIGYHIRYSSELVSSLGIIDAVFILGHFSSFHAMTKASMAADSIYKDDGAYVIRGHQV